MFSKRSLSWRNLQLMNTDLCSLNLGLKPFWGKIAFRLENYFTDLLQKPHNYEAFFFQFVVLGIFWACNTNWNRSVVKCFCKPKFKWLNALIIIKYSNAQMFMQNKTGIDKDMQLISLFKCSNAWKPKLKWLRSYNTLQLIIEVSSSSNWATQQILQHTAQLTNSWIVSMLIFKCSFMKRN